MDKKDITKYLARYKEELKVTSSFPSVTRIEKAMEIWRALFEQCPESAPNSFQQWLKESLRYSLLGRSCDPYYNFLQMRTAINNLPSRLRAARPAIETGNSPVVPQMLQLLKDYFLNHYFLPNAMSGKDDKVFIRLLNRIIANPNNLDSLITPFSYPTGRSAVLQQIRDNLRFPSKQLCPLCHARCSMKIFGPSTSQTLPWSQNERYYISWHINASNHICPQHGKFEGKIKMIDIGSK